MRYLVTASLDGRQVGLSRDAAVYRSGAWYDVATGELARVAFAWLDFHGMGYYPNQMGREVDFIEREGGTEVVVHLPPWPRRDVDAQPGTVY